MKLPEVVSLFSFSFAHNINFLLDSCPLLQSFQSIGDEPFTQVGISHLLCDVTRAPHPLVVKQSRGEWVTKIVIFMAFLTPYFSRWNILSISLCKS